MTAARVHSAPSHRSTRLGSTAKPGLVRWRSTAHTGSKSSRAPDSAPSSGPGDSYIFLSLSMPSHGGSPRARHRSRWSHRNTPSRPSLRGPVYPFRLHTGRGLVAKVGATDTIVPRDLLIALAPRWSARIGSSGVGKQEGRSRLHGLADARGTWRICDLVRAFDGSPARPPRRMDI
jgi:hypothetical protein